jgi:hypothetical protein
MTRIIPDYYVVMIRSGRCLYADGVDPELTRANIVQRIRSGEYPADSISFIHHVRPGEIPADVTDELIRESQLEWDSERKVVYCRADRVAQAWDHHRKLRDGSLHDETMAMLERAP